MSDHIGDITKMVLHSIAPWFLARYQPSLERTARENLSRVGFENWYPTILDMRALPLRKIPPKKRHLAPRFIQEVRRPRFVGYILIRPLPICRFDINRLFDLTGCGSVVSCGEHAARIEDFDVELMRLAEARGTFDTFIGAASQYRTRISKQAQETWTAQGKRLLALDEARKLGLCVDAFGRIEQLIAQARGPEFIRPSPAEHRL